VPGTIRHMRLEPLRKKLLQFVGQAQQDPARMADTGLRGSLDNCFYFRIIMVAGWATRGVFTDC